MRAPEIFERELPGGAGLPPEVQRCPGAVALPAYRRFEIDRRLGRLEMLVDDHPQRRGQAELALRGRRYSLISSTVFFTDWNDFSNAAFSSAVSSIWWIFSTPLPPMVTGTPM